MTYRKFCNICMIIGGRTEQHYVDTGELLYEYNKIDNHNGMYLSISACGIVWIGS